MDEKLISGHAVWASPAFGGTIVATDGDLSNMETLARLQPMRQIAFRSRRRVVPPRAKQ